MIAYDMVLEDLPERVRELTVRLRDLVLSLGPGISEHVKSNALEYEVNRRFAVLAPDKLGVSLKFHGPFDPPLEDSHGRLTTQGSAATIRLASAADIDDPLRRVCRAAFQQAAARERVRRQIEVQAVPDELREALDNVSRGLRLLIHHMQSMEKAAQQRARSLERQGQKRSHKKKPPPAPPVLVIGEKDALPLPARPPAKKPARPAKKPVKKAAAKKAPARKTKAKPANKKKR